MMKKLLFVLAFLVVPALLAAQSDEVVPNENLVAEGIPKIPSAIAEAAGRYGEFRAADMNSWHPTRREMLIETRFAETAQVHLVKFPGGARTQLSVFPLRIAGGRYLPASAQFFFFKKEAVRGAAVT